MYVAHKNLFFHWNWGSVKILHTFHKNSPSFFKEDNIRNKEGKLSCAVHTRTSFNKIYILIHIFFGGEWGTYSFTLND